MRTAALTSGDLLMPSAAPARAAGPASATRARERARRRVVGLVLLIYLLLIFEGSIRKWVLPQLSLYVFFIRDPFVLIAYFLAFRYRLWPRRGAFLWVIGLLAGAGLLIGSYGIMANVAGDSTAMLVVYGWRNYFLYAPLAFLIGAQFNADDLARLCRWTLLLAAPIGLLVAAQFSAAPNAAINVGSATDQALQFAGIALDSEHTRPMGTFSSVAAQGQFVATAFAMLLAWLATPRRLRAVPRWLLLLGAAGVATCVALGGSRGALISCVLIAVIGMAFGLVARAPGLKVRMLMLPLLVGVVFAVLYPVVFPEGFEAFAGRWQAAAAAESQIGGVTGRALFGFFDFFRLMGDAPVLGYGLGIGGNAATTLGVASLNAVPYAETDWARHIVDLGPVFGLAYILLRIVLTVWLGFVVLKGIRRGSGPLPLFLYAYVALVMIAGQITGQGGINGYAWIFTGLTIAAAAARPAPGAPAARKPNRARAPLRARRAGA